MLSAVALEGLPEVAPGDDLAELVVSALASTPDAHSLSDGDVLVVAHKVVSKAEGRIRALSGVRPGKRAAELAGELEKDPRHVQAILDETSEVLRATRGVLICLTPQGFVCANAGVDTSNVPGDDSVVLLPVDPDASARSLRAALRARTGVTPGVLITDSFGRAWRHGQCDVAIGCAGLGPLEDWRGRPDAVGKQMAATWIAVADELAATADLARTKDGSQPVVVVAGAGHHVTPEDGPGATALIRPEQDDLFR